MSMSRYEIRNEYSLADPELYRVAEKDDPEALLEGVAMAGLVGVLRQLGDLAEFAAEIFHNLHEEVMATAARGHGLMARVQQLETEIPSIERAFLSQTDHSSFFYHSGIDWHRNLRLDQNIITQGDLPRFVMDSYEECRAPPRLFLLDKFDVAGAGACLKRYTDPSFFKVENSEIISADVQREKKIRKIKKKGPRRRNGETPGVLPTTHTKLHQLFLEERVEVGASKPFARAKLKRRLNGFPFDLKTGKSYMEILLKSPSPDHEVLQQVTMNSSSLMKAENEESGFETFDVRPVSPDRESWWRKRSPPSPDEEENMLNPSMNDPNKFPIDDKLLEAPNSCPTIASNGISSTLEKVTAEKVVAVDAEGDREESLAGYESDNISSEIDNYVDAPSNMDSEMHGDSELRVKSDITSPPIENGSLILDADEGHHHTRLSDSQSTGGSTMSYDGNNSSTKDTSSLSSDSPSISVENTQEETFSAEGFRCGDVPANEMVDTSSYQKTVYEDFQVDHQSKYEVSDDTCSETDPITNGRSDFEQLTSCLCNNKSVPDLAHSDSGEVVAEGLLKAPESDEIVTTLDGEEKEANLVIDPPRSPSLCGFQSQKEDDSPGFSAGEHPVDEPNGEILPCVSTVPDIYCHTADISGKASLDSLHKDESCGKDRNLVDDIASTSDMLNDLSTNDTLEIVSSENLIPGKLEDEISTVLEYSPSDCPVTAHNGDNIKSAVSMEDNDVFDEHSNCSTDSPNPCSTEASLGKELEETYLVNAQTANEDNHSYSSIDNQISSVNLKLSHVAESPDRMIEGFDAHAGDVIPEEETTTDETPAPETLEPCEVVGSEGTGINHPVSPNDSVAPESSPCAPRDLEERAGTADSVEMDGISLWLSSTGQEVTEISGSADLKSVDEVHVLSDKSDSEADKYNTALPAVCGNASLNKLVEKHRNSFEDSGKGELEDDESCPSECHGKSNVVEKVDPMEASASASETTFSYSVNNDPPESEVPGIIPNSDFDLKVDHGLKFFQASMIESPVERCGVDREQELFDQSDFENHALDVPSLPVDYGTKESIEQEKTGLPVSQIDQDSLHPGEISSGCLPSLPINHLQMLDSRPSIHEIDVPGFPNDSLSYIIPSGDPFSEMNQINLSDLPPLPPLPPLEWRMGKLQHASFSTEGEIMTHKELSPQLISPLPLPSDSVSPLPVPTSTDDVSSSPPTALANDVKSSLEESKHSPIEITPEAASKEENVENNCSSLEANTLHEITVPKIENKQQKIVMPISESVSTSPAEEVEVENGSRTAKLPWPHNPLIDDVAVLDKSKLRKVTERVLPEIQKVDKRDSLFEQIQTKSFNLKPAMASRPSIRGPNTNLRVAAILEKANAIRQALTGSDEDDSDSWSDS